MTISGFVAYVKQAWKNKPDASTPISAERLLHMESGIKGNSDAIERLAAAVVNQIVNDPNKIASMAALFALNQKITELNGNIDNLLALKTLSIPVIEGSNYVDLDFEIPDGYMLLTWKLLRDSNIVYHTQLVNNTKIRIWNTSSAQGSARGNVTLIFAREQL